MSDKRREIDWASAEVHEGHVVTEMTATLRSFHTAQERQEG
jgi:hypothetical protein